MFPGMNPRDVQNAMKRMGIKQEQIEATEVLIKTSGPTLRIVNPNVMKVNMMGQDSYQITGDVEEVEELPSISDEDIQTVVAQANCSEEEARKALEESSGDIAQAILKIQS